MSPLAFPRRAIAAALLIGATLAPAAHAADANVRSINRATDGSVTAGMSPFAVSGRGTEVLAILGPQLVVRDVAAGTTTRLPGSGSVRWYTTTEEVDASNDLRFVLYPTEEALLPQDTDTDVDYYLLDRSTGTNQLVSRTSSTFDDGSAVFRTDIQEAQLSGDGQTVFFRSIRAKFNPALGSIDRYQADEWRWDRGTNTATRLGGSPLAADYPRTGTWNLRLMRGDDAGKVGVFDHVVYAGTRTVPLPLATGTYDSAIVSVSADGGTLAFTRTASRSTITFVNVATGASSDTTVPSWLAQVGYDVIGVGNGGTGVVVRARLNRTAGTRDVLGWVSKAGTVTQIGKDILTSGTNAAVMLASNVAFAANGQYLAQIGNTALPGSEPSGASIAKVQDYISVNDTACFISYFNVTTWNRATVTLSRNSVGLDPRVPARATVRVVNTANPATVYNAFTLSAGGLRELTIPRTGGWTVQSTVTFTDGSTLGGTTSVPAHPVPTCLGPPIGF